MPTRSFNADVQQGACWEIQGKDISLISGLVQDKGATSSDDGLLASRTQNSSGHCGRRWDRWDLGKVTLRQPGFQITQESAISITFLIAVTKYLT